MIHFLSFLMSLFKCFFKIFGISTFGTLTTSLEVEMFSAAEYFDSSSILINCPGSERNWTIFLLSCSVELAPLLAAFANELLDDDFRVNALGAFPLASSACLVICCFDRKLGSFGIRNLPDLRVSP